MADVHNIGKSTEIGRRAKLQADQLFFQNAQRILQTRTVEGNKLRLEAERLSQALLSYQNRDKAVMDQSWNESKLLYVMFMFMQET